MKLKRNGKESKRESRELEEQHMEKEMRRKVGGNIAERKGRNLNVGKLKK